MFSEMKSRRGNMEYRKEKPLQLNVSKLSENLIYRWKIVLLEFDFPPHFVNCLRKSKLYSNILSPFFDRKHNWWNELNISIKYFICFPPPLSLRFPSAEEAPSIWIIVLQYQSPSSPILMYTQYNRLNSKCENENVRNMK